MAPRLLGFSAEVLQCIFDEVHPPDLGALARTCKTLNDFINPNRLLWKTVFLQHYDDPSQPGRDELDWSSTLRRYTRVRKILQSSNVDLKRSNLAVVAKTANELVASSSSDASLSRNIAILDEQFKSRENFNVFLSSSSLFQDAGEKTQIPADDEEERQLSAKLHVLYGVPDEEEIESQGMPLHSYARARVYDLRRYNDRTMWGPFRDDGSKKVDWEKVETIMILLAYNLKAFTTRTCRHFDFIWSDHFHGCSPNSYMTQLMDDEPPNPISNIMQFLMPPISTNIASLYSQPALPLEAQDPYGVTGTWRRVVCFLDYTDLYAFNFEAPRLPDDQSRQPISTHEATRLITIKLYVTRIEPPGPKDDQDLPVVHFNGKSRSIHTSWDPNANSRVRGTVRRTSDGEIRWTSFSIFHGEERWRSECVQVGGIRSARGVLGTWFDKDYDAHGPAGPTAFWKLSDHISEEDKKVVPTSVWDIDDGE